MKLLNFKNAILDILLIVFILIGYFTCTYILILSGCSKVSTEKNQESRAFTSTPYTYCVEPCDCARGGRYPVFQIPLDGLHGFVDFALKASTNNFDNTNPDTALCYWYESLGKTFDWWWNNATVKDINANVFVSASAVNGNIHDKSFVKIDINTAMSQQILYSFQNTVLISPSHNVPDADRWMDERNEKLVWAYKRRTAISNEPNWHPIAPVYWRKDTQLNP